MKTQIAGVDYTDANLLWIGFLWLYRSNKYLILDERIRNTLTRPMTKPMKNTFNESLSETIYGIALPLVRWDLKAAVFYGQKRIDIEDKPVPKIGPKDALVKAGYCGICGSDRYMWRNAWVFPLIPENKPAKLPHRLENTPGHEVTGTIVELGKDVE